jgi:antitoxin (DNA-binding transcriptional repressor) of toxin-antitoxin stability system
MDDVPRSLFGAIMKSVSVTELKAHCLALIDEVHRTRRPVQVTWRRKPIAEIVPVPARPARNSNPLRGSILYQSDLIAPVASDQGRN